MKCLSKRINQKGFLALTYNPEILQILFKFILCSQTSIRQITFFIIPLFQSTIIKQFQIILNDKRNNIIVQTFLEHNQSSDTTVTISLCQVWDKNFINTCSVVKSKKPYLIYINNCLHSSRSIPSYNSKLGNPLFTISLDFTHICRQENLL